MYICIILANLVNKVMHEANARINGKFLFFEWITFIFFVSPFPEAWLAADGSGNNDDSSNDDSDEDYYVSNDWKKVSEILNIYP